MKQLRPLPKQFVAQKRSKGCIVSWGKIGAEFENSQSPKKGNLESF
jgi:hypothetical protein